MFEDIVHDVEWTVTSADVLLCCSDWGEFRGVQWCAEGFIRLHREVQHC